MATESPVGEVQVEDQVMTQAGGACAEMVAVDAGLVLRGLAIEQAAALPSGLLTEHDALSQAGFTNADAVLITGATSGVGLIGVQLARALGAASVVATTRGRRAITDLHDLGADLVIDTDTETITNALTREPRRARARRTAA